MGKRRHPTTRKKNHVDSTAMKGVSIARLWRKIQCFLGEISLLIRVLSVHQCQGQEARALPLSAVSVAGGAGGSRVSIATERRYRLHLSRNRVQYIWRENLKAMDDG